MRMLSGFVNSLLYAVGALKDDGAPAALHAAAAAAAGTPTEGPPVLRRCWRMEKAGRISDLKLVVRACGCFLESTRIDSFDFGVYFDFTGEFGRLLKQ
jgi:hypothetical protein